LRGHQTSIDPVNAIRNQDGNQIPVLIVTGDIASKQLRAVRDKEFPVLHKPVAPVKLRAFLSHLLKRQNSCTH